MTKSFLATALLVLSSLVSVSTASIDAPRHVEKRGFEPLKDKWAKAEFGSGQYTLYNNLHGSDQSGTSGSQTTQALSYNDAQKTISWKTQYSWNGNPGNVKSYPNVALEQGLRMKLSDIDMMPTAWNWKYESTGPELHADVAYDLWLSNDPNAGTAKPESTFEIMVWLSNRNAGPAGEHIATAKIARLFWQVWKGKVGNWIVYSFVAPYEMTDYKGDLKHFFTYLKFHQQLDLNQYLVGFQAGTEPFMGSATFVTNSYKAAIN